MKTCTKCHKTKSRSEFHRDKKNSDEKRSWCKSCMAEKDKNYLRNNYSKVLARNRQYYHDQHERGLLRSAKQRAKKRDLSFNLVVTDIEIPNRCPILGISLSHEMGRGLRPNSPSLDRIKPELGYVKGNVRVISHRANTLRSNASLDEIAAIYKDAQTLGLLE